MKISFFMNYKMETKSLALLKYVMNISKKSDIA